MPVAEWQIRVAAIPTARIRINLTAIPTFAETICGVEWEDERAALHYQFAAALPFGVASTGGGLEEAGERPLEQTRQVCR
jgi:hypothetical protein